LLPLRLVGKTERKLAVLEDKLRRSDEVIAEIMEHLVRTKRSWGELNSRWAPHKLRDTVVEFLSYHVAPTGLLVALLLRWLALCPRRFHRWQDRYDKINEHNAMILRDHWIEVHERAAIIDFARRHPLECLRGLTFMMLDRDVAAVSPATT